MSFQVKPADVWAGLAELAGKVASIKPAIENVTAVNPQVTESVAMSERDFGVLITLMRLDVGVKDMAWVITSAAQLMLDPSGDDELSAAGVKVREKSTGAVRAATRKDIATILGRILPVFNGHICPGGTHGKVVSFRQAINKLSGLPKTDTGKRIDYDALDYEKYLECFNKTPRQSRSRSVASDDDTLTIEL